MGLEYRFSLKRIWPADLFDEGGGGDLLWALLNPSTASDDSDDQTSRQVESFSRRFGFDSYTLVNLLPVRATVPAALQGLDLESLRTEENRRVVTDEIVKHDDVMFAWGASTKNHPQFAIEAAWINELADASGVRRWCMGTTHDGSPKHPLFLPGTTTPQSFGWRGRWDDR